MKNCLLANITSKIKCIFRHSSCHFDVAILTSVWNQFIMQPCVLTSANSFDGKCGLGQEVWIGEHVFFVDHEAQEGKLRLVHGKGHGVSFPCWVEAVVTWGGREGQNFHPHHLCPVQSQVFGLNTFRISYGRRWSCSSRPCTRTAPPPRRDWRCCGRVWVGAGRLEPAEDKLLAGKDPVGVLGPWRPFTLTTSWYLTLFFSCWGS